MNKKEQEIMLTDEGIMQLARCALPLIQAFYKSEKGKQMFIEWQTKQLVIKEESA